MYAETCVHARGCVRTRCVYTLHTYRSRKHTYAAFKRSIHHVDLYAPWVRKRTHPRKRTHRRVYTHMRIRGVGSVNAPTCVYAPDAASRALRIVRLA